MGNRIEDGMTALRRIELMIFDDQINPSELSESRGRGRGKEDNRGKKCRYGDDADGMADIQ